MEGRLQTRVSVLGMEERRKERTAATFLCCRLITVGSWLEPTVINITVGYWLKPAVMWSFTAGFSPAPIIFFIFKLITGSEGTSLLVVTNPTVMRPAVMSKSGVVGVRVRAW